MVDQRSTAFCGVMGVIGRSSLEDNVQQPMMMNGDVRLFEVNEPTIKLIVNVK